MMFAIVSTDSQVTHVPLKNRNRISPVKPQYSGSMILINTNEVQKLTTEKRGLGRSPAKYLY